MIHTATRIGKTSEALLNLILKGNSRRILKTGTVDVQISDHSVTYAVIRASASRLRSRKNCLRSLKNYNYEMFVNDFHKIPIHMTEVFHDIDDNFFSCLSHYAIMQVFKDHAATKQFQMR